MLFERFLPLQYRRKRLLQQSPPGPLHDFLSVPFVDADLDYRDTSFLAVDLETTGLDIHTDHILSIGMVTINTDGIDLNSARHIVVNTSRSLPAETVTIHKLTDDIISAGVPVSDAIQVLLESLAGKVLLAHHARVECGFIGQACMNLYKGKWISPVSDTQKLGIRRLARSDSLHRPDRMRLDSLRADYGLPSYQAHNALADAIATAELFLAELSAISGGNERVPLKSILSCC